MFGAVTSKRPVPTVESAGGIIAGVRPDGRAASAGLQVGDRVITIDGLVPRDLTDIRYQLEAQDSVTLDVLRDGRLLALEIDLDGASDLGIDFEQPAFDGLRQCNNNCDFCFIRGLPKGLRRSLYVRDDDYRYSFLFGSFVTLTNLAQEDWHRIAFQRLSPLRVSIHATDPELRARLLKHPGAAPIMPQLRWLGQAGVEVHAQVVLCPDLNDGDQLEQTIRDLMTVEHVVRTVAVVPVGISDFLHPRDVRPVTGEDAVHTLRLLERLRRECRRAFGRRFVYPADELFLLAQRPLPGTPYYDGFPQLQNGVGLVRVMLNDWHRSRDRLPAALNAPRRVAWLCGRAAAPALREMAADAAAVDGLEVVVHEVDNSLFGAAITVSGLMSGRDMVRALRLLDVERAVVPRSAFGFEGQRTLDEWTVEQIAAESGVSVRLGRTASELIECTVE